MLASSLNTQSATLIASLLSKRTSSAILPVQIKGYAGGCPFLKQLGSISHYSSNQSGEHHGHQSSSMDGIKKCPFIGSFKDSDRSEIIRMKTDYADEIDGHMTIQRLEDAIRNERVEKSYKMPEESYDYSTKMDQLIKTKKEDDTYRIFRKVRRFSANFPHGTERERPVTIWCSNDYFGMSSHRRVQDAIRMGLEKYGAGSGGTRNIAGNSPLHEGLEWELADLHDKEAALVFSSCFVANDSTLFTLLKLIPDCHIFSDAGNHASMIQGIRNSGAPRHLFRNFDPEDLEEKLKQVPISTPKIVAFETVHSMTGDIGKVEKMCDIAHKYGALTFVDEVHAVGLYGHRGAGIGQRDGCMHKIDIVSGTLGKAYGNFGGYIASTAEIVDVVRSYAAGFIFTTSLPPTVLCGSTESVRILKSDEGRRLRSMQQNNVKYLKQTLSSARIPHYDSESHIVPIPVGTALKCTKVSADLLNLGHYIQSINYPTVARGTERLRLSISPFHNERMIDSMVEILSSVWKDNNLEFMEPVANDTKKDQNDNLTESDTNTICELCNKEVDSCTRIPLVN